MSPTSNTVLKPCRQNKPKLPAASKLRGRNKETSRNPKPPKHGGSALRPSSTGSRDGANPGDSTSKQSKKSSAKPGFELVEISTEFAGVLRACVDFFEYRGTIGELIEREADWVFENLLNDTCSGGEVMEFLRSFRLRGKRHAQRVADRWNARCAEAGKEARAEVIREGNRWELEFYSLDYLHWSILRRWCRQNGHEFEPYRVLALKGGTDRIAERIMAITGEVVA